MASSAKAVAQSSAHKRIAVAGNPNSGKTALFNSLTGLRQKVGNYPGVTVEKREGSLAGSNTTLLDLPGTYSLSARSPDEQIARDVLQGHVDGLPRLDGVLLVVDASNLERNLYLVSQMIDFGVPVVVACNMMDVAARRGLRIDCAALSRELGVPVIATVASRGEGVEAVRRALVELDHRAPGSRPFRLPEPFEDAVARVAQAMEHSGVVEPHAVGGAALLWLSDYLSGEASARRSAEKLLHKLLPPDAAEARAAAAELAERHQEVTATVVEARYAWISDVVARSVSAHGDATSGHGVLVTRSDRLDQVLTHRVFGLLIFAVVMFVVFVSIFSLAEPLMDLIESGQHAAAAWIGTRLGAGPLHSLITDGVIAGVGAVVSFFPQICILFLCLAILEDSGYMARAAFIMDRLMSRFGLHGKSFIPLLSSYACAIPGIMATRTIENRRDRFTTILIAPLMSCSARLPVYLIVIGAVFGDHVWLKAVVMFSLYVLGTATALGMALVFKKTIFAGPRPTFIMELPPYHMPRPWAIVRAMWDRSKLFLTQAGTTIFCASIVIWTLSYFPGIDEADFSPEVRTQLAALHGQSRARENIIAGQRLRGSYIGRLGRALEPAIEPLGYDWRIGVGVLSSFLAREVFVSTMGITFAVGEVDETSCALREKLASASWPDGRRVLTPLVGISLMVFYVLACQCVSTLAVVRRETNSWRWPALMFGYMTVLAYTAALCVNQVGMRLGFGAW